MHEMITIGQMSKLFGTTKQTLIHYDQIGLLKPVKTNPLNGHRYYSITQFSQLYLINDFKSLGLSLNEIKFYLQVRNEDILLKILKDKSNQAHNMIEGIKQIITRFDHQIEKLEEARQVENIGIAIIKQLPERKILIHKEYFTTGTERELCMKKLQRIAQQYSLIDMLFVGVTISENDLQNGNFDHYNGVYFLIRDINYQNDYEIFPASEYACIHYRGGYGEAPQYYKILLDFIDINNYIIIGDSIERTIIDHRISNDKARYLRQIQIPVRNAKHQ